MKKIGVVLATYNGERYIEEQVKSIIDQTVKPDVIVVSDGGSADKTVEKCNQILKYSGIDYLILESQKRLQVTENFQKGLEHCVADYIFFSDQDDIWLNDKIEKTMTGFTDSDVMMVFTDAIIFKDESDAQTDTSLWATIGFQVDSEVKCFERYNSDLLTTLFKHNVVTGMCLAISSKLKPFLLPFPKSALHDAWIALCAIHYGSIAAVNRKCVLYRQHDSNVVGTKRSVKRILENRNRYSSNVVGRLNFISEVYDRSGIYENSYAEDLMKNYIAFLRDRCAFLQKKSAIMYPLRNFALYKQFEYSYLTIIIKDYYVRLFQATK